MTTSNRNLVAALLTISLSPFSFAQTPPVKPVAPAVPASPAASVPVKPVVPAVADPASSGVHNNDKGDFAGQGRPADKVLKEVAELIGFSVVVPDELTAPVNEDGKGVTWRDFYTLVLKKKGYTYRIDGEVVYVEKEVQDLTKKITILESGQVNVDFEKVLVSDAIAAICTKLDKNCAPLPPELEAAPAPAPGTAPAATVPKVVTIKWKGVTWQKTLNEILARYEYGFKEDDGIIRIVKLSELNNVPSETRVYRVTFADAEKVAKTITDVYKAGVAANAPAPLIATPESTQQLVIITAKPEFLRSSESHILSLISSIDQPSKQVVIESKVVERQWNNDFYLGFNHQYGPGNHRYANGSSNALIGGSTAASPDFNQSSSAASIGSSSASKTGGAMFVLSEKDYKFFMNAIEQDTTANVLQNPTLVVKDDGQGAIRIVKRQPYFEGQQSGGATAIATYTTKFINIGTSLYIKPKIKGDGFVDLKIEQGKNGGGDALTGGGTVEGQEGTGGLSISAISGSVPNPGASGTTIPITDNRDIRTNVQLKDGYTVALGGLIKDADGNTKSQVPLLGDIPVVGRLFQSNDTTKARLNLMAFITARVVDPFNTSYKEMLGMDRVNELGLNSREIEGGSYKITEVEQDSLTELLRRRDSAVNAERQNKLNTQLNGGAR